MNNKNGKKDWKIAFLPGDGTGPEIMKVVLPIIRKAAAGAGVRARISIGDAGYNCISSYGTNLQYSTSSSDSSLTLPTNDASFPDLEV